MEITKQGVPQGAMPLAWLIAFGFIGISAVELFGFYMLILNGAHMTPESAPLWIGLSNLAGAIFAAFAANMQTVVNYIFGSSAGSRAKSDQSAELAQTVANNTK